MAKVVAEARLEGEALGVADLKAIDIFADVPERQIEMYPGTVVRRRFKAGDIICRQGEGGTTAFYIVDGEVNISILRRSQTARRRSGGLTAGLLAVVGGLFKQRQARATRSHDAGALVPIDASVDLRYGDLTAVLKKGDHFGEMSCLNLDPRSATAVARTDCVLIEILRNMYTILQGSKTFKDRNDRTYRERALDERLRGVAVFEGISDEAVKRLRENVELLSVDAGTVILKEGDAADCMYLIRVGQVRVSKMMPGGEVTQAYLTKGDVFGEIGLLRGSKRSSTCAAVDHPVIEGGRKRRRARVELVKIKGIDVEWLMAEFPQVRQRLEAKAQAREEATHRTAGGDVHVEVPPRVEQMGLIQGQGLLLIDLEKCTRCDQCVDACVASHDDGVTRLVREGPRYDKYLVPSRCRMCIDPVCMIGCPVGSIRRTKDLNILIEDWCVGCGVCAKQCPYDSIQMHDVSEFGDDGAGAATEAAQEDRERAVVCDQCSTLPTGPACVHACPHDAAIRVNGRDFFAGVTVSAGRGRG